MSLSTTTRQGTHWPARGTHWPSRRGTHWNVRSPKGGMS
jgi:hypothetical protein